MRQRCRKSANMGIWHSAIPPELAAAPALFKLRSASVREQPSGPLHASPQRYHAFRAAQHTAQRNTSRNEPLGSFQPRTGRVRRASRAALALAPGIVIKSMLKQGFGVGLRDGGRAGREFERGLRHLAMAHIFPGLEADFLSQFCTTPRQISCFFLAKFLIAATSVIYFRSRTHMCVPDTCLAP